MQGCYPGSMENPRGLGLALGLALAKSMAKCWPVGANDPVGQGLTQAWEKKHNSFPLSSSLKLSPWHLLDLLLDRFVALMAFRNVSR